MIGWIILWAGLGTYAMRSMGIWLPPKLFPDRWLTYLPLSVILVMTVGSLYSFSHTNQEAIAAIVASIAVIISNLKKLPLIASIVIGCLLFGAIAGA